MNHAFVWGGSVKFLSVCSGIEAASVAWGPLGFEAIAFAEIAKFPSAVLDTRFPDVPNLGNMENYEKWNIGPIDILAGGTPCQPFSIAGKRGGLDDERGNLCLTFCRIADKFSPEWVLWENVPGVLSSCYDKTKPESERVYAFGCFLGELCGAGRALHPHEFGGRFPNCGVVSGSKRTVAWRVLNAEWFGVPQRRRRLFVLASRGAGNWKCADALLPIGESLPWDLEASRKARKETASHARRGVKKSHWHGGVVPGVSPAVTSKCAKGSGVHSGDGTKNLVMVFENHAQDSRVAGPVDVSPTCTSKWGTGGGNTPLVVTYTLHTATTHRVSYGPFVRRITPRESERLQGFPDDWTNIKFGRKAEPVGDAHRYMAAGNSWAIPVVAWIGRQIQKIESRVE